MSQESFCCPVCKGALETGSGGLRCETCDRSYPIVERIADFFVSETTEDFIDEPSKTWLDPKIVDARDTIYSLCARELHGMRFCMQEIGQRTGENCLVLEVGMGTGHFTRWLDEVSLPGTEIFAFDFSWPIIKKAQVNTYGLSKVTLFRANARGQLPFEQESFDIVFLRLASLGGHGVPNVQAGFELLKPGGWYFEAGWEQARYDTSPTDWAVEHGFDYAEEHEWQYYRIQNDTERAASEMELDRLVHQGGHAALKTHLQTRITTEASRPDSLREVLTFEHLLIARKPFQSVAAC